MTLGRTVMNGETVSESCVAGYKAYCMNGSEYCMNICLLQILPTVRLRCAVRKSAKLLLLGKMLLGNPNGSLCSRGKL